MLKHLLLSLLVFFSVVYTLVNTSQASASQNETIGILEAVQKTIRYQADIELGRKDVDFARGAHQETEGQFDTRLNAGLKHGTTRTPLTAGEQEKTTSSYQFGLSKQLRSGLIINPHLETTRNKYEFSSQDPSSQTGAYLEFTLPLLKGFGTLATAGNAQAARKDISNSRLELKHSIAQAVLDAAQTYWQYVLDYKRLQELRSAERRARELKSQTKALVQADERPASDLDEVEANLADKVTRRIAGEQSLMQSRQALGLAMGVPFARMRSLAAPADGFELLQIDKQALACLKGSSLLDYALQQRYDLQASKGREESATIRKKVQKNRLLPNLDLGMQVGYQSLLEDSSNLEMLKSPIGDVPGASWQLSLTYEFPVQNREARGRLNQQRVQKRRQEIRRRELARRIQSNVHTTLSLLHRNRRELVNARKTVELYEQAVENQLMKYKMGMGTQLDLIKTQDSLTEAKLNELSALYRYSNSLSKLRFETSTLVSFKGDQARVELQNLAALPRISKSGK
jgi:outer membrane protein TolC